MVPMKITYAIIIPLLIVMTSCGTRSVHRELEEEIPVEGTTVSYVDWQIETEVSALTIAAGETLDVRCIITRGGDLLTGTRTYLAVTPSLSTTSLVEVSGAYQFTATQTGAYSFQCQTPDGHVVDPHPSTVRVIAGAPVAVETSLESSQVQAGAPVDVNCQGFDTYGNVIEEQPEETTLSIDHLFEVHRGLQEEFVVRGTIIGSYSVACAIGPEVLDETPETLIIVPGVAADSTTTVTPGTLRPTESATITCSYTDLYGNLLSDVPSSISVLPESGHSDAVNGITLEADQFSAIKQGRYFVFCSTPGFYAGDETPAEVIIRPGLPYSWNVDMLQQECYWQDRAIPVNYSIYDYWGNEVDDAVVDTTVIPAEGVVVDDDGNLLLAREAEYSFTLEITSPLHPENTISPFSDSLRVDSTPPTIQIASPARSAMLQEGSLADHDISIDGSVSDVLSYIVSASLNGQDLSAGGNSSVLNFSGTQSSRWGMSVITATSEDECGNVSVHAQSYLRSPQYFDASTTASASARASTGLLAHLNQPIIDDYDRSDLDDIASLGQAILQGLDFNSLVAPGQALAQETLSPSSCSWGQFTSDTGYFIGRHSDANRLINASGPYVHELRAVDGGIAFTISVNDLDFPLTAWAALIVCAGIGGVQPATISIDNAWVGAEAVDVTGTLGITIGNAGPEATLTNLNIATNGLYLDADCGIFDFLCDAITNLVIPLVSGLIEDALEDAIASQIPALLEDVFNGFQIEAGFDLPAPIDMTLNINSGFDYSHFSSGTNGNGYGQLGLAAQVFPASQGESISNDARGAIRKNGNTPNFSATDYAFGLGLKDDLLNQMMWALWYGGGLHFDNLIDFVSESAGGAADQDFSDLISMSLRAEMPPVIMPGANGEDIDIGLGDVWIEASVDLIGLIGGEATEPTITVGMYLSTILSGSLDIDSVTNELQIAVSDNPEVYVQVVELDDMGYQSLMSDLFTRVLKLILPRLFSNVLGSFPLPEFDLSTLAGEGLVPPGTVWKLTNGSLDRPNSDYYRLSGSLQ